MSFSPSPNAMGALAREAKVLGQESRPAAFVTSGARELEEERQRLRDIEPTVEPSAASAARAVERSGSPTTTSFVGGSSSQSSRSPTGWRSRSGSPRSVLLGRDSRRRTARRRRRQLSPTPSSFTRGDRLARELEWDRHVTKPASADRVCDDRALVADDRIFDPCLRAITRRTDWNIRPVTSTT